MKRSGPIRRKTRIPRVNPERRRSAFRRCFHSDEFVAWTRRQPCAHCGGRPSQAAHLKSRGAGGTWVDVIPLCAGCHASQHYFGAQTFAAKSRVDLKAAAEAHALRWLRLQEAA